MLLWEPTLFKTQMSLRILFSVTVACGMLIGGCTSSKMNSSADFNADAGVETVPGRTISPGAPGQPSRVMTEDEIKDTSALPYNAADVHFMSGMIAHHAQALEMTALVTDRTNRKDLHMLAKRIDISQTSEINLMQKWLRDRNEMVPAATSKHMMDGKPMLMPGIVSESDMAMLTEADGDDFYGQFLTLMIGHHVGAIKMVDELLSTPGAAQDTYVFRFATDVDVDQRMEISRMQQMIDGLH